MDHMHKVLDDFSPELYIAILSSVAHSDGLDREEKGMLEDYASRLGVDLDAAMPEVPEDMSQVPWTTRILVYRDAYILALADGLVSPDEAACLVELADKLKLSPEKAESVQVWAHDYERILERFDEILETVE